MNTDTSFELNNIVVKVKYAKAKSLSCRFVSKREILVKVPDNYTQNAIRNILIDNWDIIVAKIKLLPDISHNSRWDNGAEIYFGGKKLSIRQSINVIGKIMIENNYIIFSSKVNTKDRRDIFVSYCKRKARTVFIELVGKYCKMTNLEYRDLRIKDTNTRWGSCSSKNNLNFNWRLIMAPPEVLEYVVIHEVCHLAHPNHGIQFWSMVEKLCKEYRVYARWLKRHSNLLLV